MTNDDNPNQGITSRVTRCKGVEEIGSAPRFTAKAKDCYLLRYGIEKDEEDVGRQ